MASFNQTVVLDGINDFSIFGRSFSFDRDFNFIGRVRTVLESADTGKAELVLRDDFEIDLLLFRGTPEIVIRDDGDGDRRLDYIELPDGPATLNLPVTEVNVVRGFGTAGYDLTFGDFIDGIFLGDGDDDLTVTDGGQYAGLNGGDNTVRILGGNLQQVKFNNGNNTLFLGPDGFVENIRANNGNNIFDLNAGFGTLTFGSGNNTVNFNADAFGGAITGFSNDDSVNEFTLGGEARLRSLGVSNGKDTLVLQAGSSIEQAQLGNNDDTVTIGRDARIDSLQLGSGNNVLTVNGGRSNQTIAYQGDDVVTLRNEARIESLLLGGGNNRVEMSSGSVIEQLTTYDGDDVVILSADARMVTMTLGFGNNEATTGSQFVHGIFAFDGDDDVTVGSGGAGMVRLAGGNDTIRANGFVESVVLYGGNDDVTLREGARSVGLGDGDNTLLSTGFIGRIDSGDGADRLTVAGGAADLNSGAGDDVLRLGLNSVSSAFAGDGDDLIQVGLLTGGEFVEVSGGNGFDTIDMSAVGGDLDVDLRQRENDQGENGFFAITQMEAVIGGDGSDRLAGNGADNRLTGGDNGDVFIFDRSGGTDVVTDFTVGEDRVLLEGVQSPGQVGFATVDGGVRLDYFDTSILFEGLTVGQLAQIDNFEL